MGFLRTALDDSEREFVNLIRSDPHILWETLRTCHNERGTLPQVRLMQTLNGIKFSSDMSKMAAGIQSIRDTVKHIFAQTAITPDTLIICSILQALESNHDEIRAAASSHYMSNPTAGPQWLYDRLATEIQFKTQLTGSTETVLAASGVICGNKLCGKGHQTELCFGKGGAMEGKHDEVMKLIQE